MAKKYKSEVIKDLHAEKKALDKKIAALNNFIRGVDFVSLGVRQRGLLSKQSDVMTGYSLVLRDRIVDITSQEVK